MANYITKKYKKFVRSGRSTENFTTVRKQFKRFELMTTTCLSNWQEQDSVLKRKKPPVCRKVIGIFILIGTNWQNKQNWRINKLTIQFFFIVDMYCRILHRRPPPVPCVSLQCDIIVLLGGVQQPPETMPRKLVFFIVFIYILSIFLETAFLLLLCILSGYGIRYCVYMCVCMCKYII